MWFGRSQQDFPVGRHPGFNSGPGSEVYLDAIKPASPSLFPSGYSWGEFSLGGDEGKGALVFLPGMEVRGYDHCLTPLHFARSVSGMYAFNHTFSMSAMVENRGARVHHLADFTRFDQDDPRQGRVENAVADCVSARFREARPAPLSRASSMSSFLGLPTS